MKTRTVTEQDVQQAWAEMPAAFRSTHPLPHPATHEAGQAWLAKAREDCRRVIVITLDTATADMARGQCAEGRAVAAEVRPFQRMKRVLDEVAALTCEQQAPELCNGDPLDRPCEECRAEAGEGCRVACTAQG